MPKIVDFALPPGGTIVDVAPSNATALDIESAGADYITVDTTGSGSVIIGKLLTLEAGMTFSGATTFTIPDNTENAFLVEDSTGADYLQCDTRNGAEILRLSSVGVAGVEIHVASGDAEVRLADEVGFISDPDLMLRRKTANNLEFRIAGTDIFGIDASGAYLENGNLGVGTLSPVHKAHVQDGDIGIVKNSADAVGSKLIFEKSRNATDGSHTVVSDNDVLGTVEFRGSDTNTFEAGASIIGRVQGTPSDGSMPAELAFAVTPSGSTTPVEAMHIRSNGNIGIGDNFPNTKLHVNQNSSSSTSIFYNTSTSGKGAGYSGSMAAYFDNKVGPTITLNNSTHEDSSGGRETGIHFCGEKANAGEQHTLAALMVSHSGTGDDQKGQMVIHLNTGSADHSPSALHYFDGPSANVGFNYPATAGYRLTLGGNDSNPGLSIRNGSNSDGDGSRITRIDFNGKKADNNTHNLVRIQAQHDGTGDDDKGKFTISVNDGDDGDTPSVTPFQIDSNGRTAIGTSPGTVGEVLRVRQNHTSDTLTLFENTGAGVAGEFQTNSTSNGVDILRTKNSSGITFGARADGAVFVGSSCLNNKEFEVNNGTQAFVVDIQGTTSSISILGNNNSTRQQMSVGSSQGHGLLVSKYGTAVMTSQLGEVAEWIDNQTNANRSAFLADSNTDLVLDWDVGQVGIIELVDNIDKIKFYNCPQVGRVRSFTLRIKQNASSAKTVSYSTIEFYTDKGSTAVSGTKTLQWSGGASHVMSTGTGNIDIVQFTAFSDTANTVQIYGSVIGQNFS